MSLTVSVCEALAEAIFAVCTVAVPVAAFTIGAEIVRLLDVLNCASERSTPVGTVRLPTEPPVPLLIVEMCPLTFGVTRIPPPLSVLVPVNVVLSAAFVLKRKSYVEELVMALDEVMFVWLLVPQVVT